MRSSFELSAIPYSLAHPDGTLRKATKSVLLAELEQTVNAEPRLPKTNNAPSTAHIIDGMAQVQMLKSGSGLTFGDLADKHYDMVTAHYRQPGCNRVDLVFDRYDRVQSIKYGERDRRSLSITRGENHWTKDAHSQAMEKVHNLPKKQS